VNVAKGNDRYDIDKYEAFKEVVVLVKHVSGKRPIGSANFEDIKFSGKPVFNNGVVEIYYADSPRACIEYKGDKPYSWCVSRSGAKNMYYKYRLELTDPAFYFVKRVAQTEEELRYLSQSATGFKTDWRDPFHFFVVQVNKDVEMGNLDRKYYVVTSANNDGDIKMSWNQIVKKAPELKGLQDVFQPKPLTEKEREKIEKYKNGLSDEEFENLPYVEKDFYMAERVRMNMGLSGGQFRVLPDDLKNKYIGFGVGLSDAQFEIIEGDKNLLKRYAQISQRKFDNFLKGSNEDISYFTGSELLFIDIFKDIDALKKLRGDLYAYFLRYHKNPDEIVDRILEIKGEALDSGGIFELLKYSRNRDKLVERIFEIKGIGLDWKSVGNLITYSKNKVDIARRIIEIKGGSLNSQEIGTLLKSSGNAEEFIPMILDIKGKTLDSEGIYFLVGNSQNREELATRIIDIKGKTLDSEGIYYLLALTKTHEEIIKKIIDAKRETLDSKGIEYVFEKTKNPNEVVKNMVKAGVNRYKIFKSAPIPWYRVFSKLF
jgi:hypothetical protein